MSTTSTDIMTAPASNSIVTLDEAYYRINKRIWYAILALALVDIGLFLVTGVGVKLTQGLLFSLMCVVCYAISYIYRYVRRDDRLNMLGHLTNQLLCGSAVLGVMSYLTARLGWPLLDEQLIAVDHMLGFDWKSYIAWADSSPTIAWLSAYIYASAGPQMLFMVLPLFLYSRIGQVQRFTITFICSGAIVVILAALLPAVAGYIHYNYDLSQLKHLHPYAFRVHEADYMGMREHTLNDLAFPLRGIITFPSFHSTIAILLIYASWPIRWLRFIAIPLNIGVLFATPIDGGHYLADVLGGILAAIPAIWLAEKTLPYGQYK